MPDLIQHSLQVIRDNQQPGGAYPACPTMPDYQFCWFRDGSFTAHAMVVHDETESARCFHEWSAQTILRYQEGARHAIADFQAGKMPDKHDVLRARYTYDMGKGPDNWPEFQLDGLGTWLWALKEFADRGNSLSLEIREAAEFVAEYLAVLWPTPCHDLWEEHGDQVHTYTLAAICAGLQAAGALFQRGQYLDTAGEIRQYLLKHCVQVDHGFIKSVGSDLVDGSLVALAVPYKVAAPDDALIQATIRRVEVELYKPGAGIHRYIGDSYYGGGAWLLLAAWLGWYYAEKGERAKAEQILAGIERRSTPAGDLPEQLAPPMLADQSFHDDWVHVRGPIATPLLWSHAMYLILARRCGKYSVG